MSQVFVMLRWVLLSVTVFRFSGCTRADYDSWEIQDYALFPSLPIAAPWSEDPKCREDSRKLMDNLRNKTLWATKMWDSSAKTEFGQLYGNIYQGGNFDECLSITEPIQAQYCGVSIRAYLNGSYDSDDYFKIDPPPGASVWTKLDDSRKDPSKIPRDIARWGLCVPASCSAGEMLKSVRRRLGSVNERNNGTIHYVADINEELCQKSEFQKFTWDEIAFWSLTIIIVLVVLSSSAIDVLQNPPHKCKNVILIESKAKRLYMAFSLKRNIPKLLEVPKDETARKLRTLHTGKGVVMLLVIFGHRFGVFLAGGFLNYQAYEEYLRTLHSAFFPQGEIMVEVFFGISGFLTCYFILQHAEKVKFVNPFLVILGRFLRFAPLYYYLVWFHTSALYRLGSGPVWFAIKTEVDFCKENWWTNLLFVNNYVNVDKSCMLHTWFIPCEFHLFIISVFLVLLITKHEKIGVTLLVLLTLVSAAIPGLLTYTYELTPVFLYYFGTLNSNIREGMTWKTLYVPTHARATVYFLGVLTAYIIQKSKGSTKKISSKWSVPIFVAFLAIGGAPMLYGFFYYDPWRPYDLIESTIFASLRRTVFGLGLGFYMICRYFGGLEFLNYIDWRVFLPLSKIMFSVYLGHFYMIAADVAKERIPNNFSTYELFTLGIGAITLAIIYGGFLYLAIELPFKIFFYELLFKRYAKKVLKKIGDQQITINNGCEGQPRKANPDLSSLANASYKISPAAN